jgi:stage II sporulation protein D
LEVKPNSGFLLAVVGTDLETAVASVVGAESAPDMPVEALKAQAVVARSYFVAAKGRHRDFDFCDTTHCQFLRSPPDPGTLVAQAVATTRGLVLAYESEPIATMYTRSCSGRTRTPADVGLPAASYPYYSVDCKYCREHLLRWQRQISRLDATKLRAANERERLEVDRRLGWNTVPSNTFTRQNVGDRVILRGAGQGHGIGLCQAGAGAMARDGAFFSEILAHYYPNTAIVGLDRMAESHR